MKKLMFVYNPNAGKGLLRKNICEVIDAFTKHGYLTTAYPTQAKGDGFEKIIAFGRDYDMIVCSGGDGTLSETISALMQFEPDRRPTLGYIPAGSTNDFANSLDIPRNFVLAAENAVEGIPFKCDVGTLGENYFCYVAAFGAFTHVTYQTDQSLKNKLGHMAYVIEALKSLNKIEGYDMRFEYDNGNVCEGRFILGMITNSVSVGGIVKLDKNSVIYDDGMFEVMLVRQPKNIIKFTNMLNNFVSSNMLKFSELKDKYFATFKASHIKITCEKEIAWTVDGENGGEHKEVEIKNHMQAITIVTPKLPENETTASLTDKEE